MIASVALPKHIRQVVAILLEDRRTVARALLLLLAQAVAAAVAPRLLGRAVDVAQNEAISATIVVSFLYLVIEAVRAMTARAQSVAFSTVGQGAVHRLRVLAFRHIQNLPWLTLKQLSHGDLLSRLTVDIRAASTLFEAGFLRIIERLCAVIAIIIGILSVSPSVGGAALCVLPLFLVGAWGVTRALYNAYYQRQEPFGAVMGSLSESLLLRAETSLLDLEQKRIDHFAERSARLAAVQQVPPVLFGRLHAGMSVVSGISVATILILGDSHVTAQTLSRGDIVSLVAYVSSIFWPLLFIIDQWSVLLQGLAAVERLFEIFSWPVEEAVVPSLCRESSSTDSMPLISFDRVTFEYPDTGRGVRDVSFSANRGERIGIVGPTGSGKSTISRLLLGFLTPQSGSITVAGIPAEPGRYAELRKLVGFVPQHAEMFSGSPRHNVALWDEDGNSEEWLGGSSPDYAEFIRALLSRNTNALTECSVGEQQCIAAMRVLMRKPPVIVLDEPTASMDPHIEAWLMDLVLNGPAETTCLIIAHRLSTLKRCDRILVISNGLLVEQGSHEQLLSQNGIYRHLVESDFQGE